MNKKNLTKLEISKFLSKKIGLSNKVSMSLIDCLIQILGGLFAVITTHYIFQEKIIQVSSNIRGEIPLLVSEIIATSGLILTILFIRKNDEASVAIGVSLFITAGYWFTSSTSFANPAVTIARLFTNTFTGIAPSSFVYFLTGQIAGSIIGHKIFKIFNN